MTKEEKIGREKGLAKARRRKQRDIQKVVKQNAVSISKTTTEVRDYDARRRCSNRKLPKMHLIERNVKYITHKFEVFANFGLDTIRINVDDRFNLFDKDGKYEKKPKMSGRYHFDRATEAVNFGVVEAIVLCLKKNMFRHVDMTLRCVNVVYVLLDGSSWKGHHEVSDDDGSSFFQLVRNKCFYLDMVNVLLGFVEKTYMKCGSINREALITAMHVLSVLFSVDETPANAMKMDTAKEFAVVSTLNHQLDIQQRGPNACNVVTYGCEILVQFVRMFPDLRRNCTCTLIHRLLVDVYNIFVPEPYYFAEAIAVLDELLKNDMNLNHFRLRSDLILGFLLKHNNSGIPERIVYKDLEETLYKMSKKL